MRRGIITLVVALALAWLLPLTVHAQESGPTIELFYGNDQRFGQLWQQQPFVNVLGMFTPAE